LTTAKTGRRPKTASQDRRRATIGRRHESQVRVFGDSSTHVTSSPENPARFTRVAGRDRDGCLAVDQGPPAASGEPIMTLGHRSGKGLSPRVYARIAGALYLITIVL